MEWLYRNSSKIVLLTFALLVFGITANVVRVNRDAISRIDSLTQQLCVQQQKGRIQGNIRAVVLKSTILYAAQNARTPQQAATFRKFASEIKLLPTTKCELK